MTAPEASARPAAGDRPRCGWCLGHDIYVRYHDEEWGVPVHDDRRHFEFLALEAAQAGLSWLTVLRKRRRYRELFAGFDPERVRRMSPADVDRVLRDPGIVRNRRKVEAVVHNAGPFIEIQREHGSFSSWLWSRVGGRTIVNHWRTLDQVPASTPLSQAISRELKRRGFRFVGPTTIYAHLQAAGLVDDHLVSCFRRCGGG